MTAANVLPLKTAIGRWARDVHGQALDTMPGNMRGYAPIDTGELRRSIRRDHRAGGFSADRITGRIVAPVVQARTTDQGAPPHVIRPRRAGGLLVFMWPRVGRTVFLRRVNHPGNKAKPWWRRALQATYGPALRHAAVRTSLRR